MPDYRRAAVPGGTYFFTLVSERRQPILTRPDIRQALREAIETVRLSQHSLSTPGYCCPIICTPSGACRPVTGISPIVGD